MEKLNTIIIEKLMSGYSIVVPGIGLLRLKKRKVRQDLSSTTNKYDRLTSLKLKQENVKKSNKITSNYVGWFFVYDFPYRSTHKIKLQKKHRLTIANAILKNPSIVSRLG